MKIYNTLTKEKEEFKPLEKGKVKIYTCGPTVYWYAHIGNLRTFIFEDILVRTLKMNGFDVKWVMNITDVGHLTSDADTGEDKMEKGAKREGKTVWEIADFYTKAFLHDISMLNLLKPNKLPKATDHIQEMIELVKKLEKKGYTYKTSDGIYFDTSKFKNYGKLTGMNFAKLNKNLKAGARVEFSEEKRNITDFSVWKFSPAGSKRQMEWDSPWGTGFPGWHIECSAMSMKYLGEKFDIHCGGVDHIAVHHTNEIAQTEGATGEKWVNYWMHGEFLLVNMSKMAKSKGNIFTLQELSDKGYDPLVFRYFCLTGHYRSQLNFTFKAMDSAKNSLHKLRGRIQELKRNLKGRRSKVLDTYLKKFKEFVNDDLNIPEALALLWKGLKDSDLNNKEKYELALEMDKIFGLNLDKEEEETPFEINELLEKREDARKKKAFGMADKIREQIRKKGWEVEDTPEGARVRKS